MRRRLSVLSVPALLVVVSAVGGGGSVPAANTDRPVSAVVGGDRIVLANQSRCVEVPGAVDGDVAVVNITNTQARGTGWGALRPFGETPVFHRPVSAQYSSVNFAANTPPNPNLAFTAVGDGGRFCHDGALADHNVLLDLAAVIPAANVDAVAPSRLLDTRSGGLVAANSSRCVAVAGASVGDVAVVNITNTQAAGSGWGAVRSSDDTPVYSRPTSAQYSSVNFAGNTPPNPNLAVTEIGADGEFCYDAAVAAHHVLLDLGAVIPAANVNAIDPIRLLDTRNGGDLVAAGTSRCVEVAGAGDGDVAVVNITNTQATGAGWGALRSPAETPVSARPVSGQYSSVNFAANTPPNPNLALAVIDGGEFCYDAAVASHHLLLDLAAVIPAANVNAITPTRLLDTRDEQPDLDKTFGVGGRVTTPGYLSDAAQQVALQPDGKIVMVGQTDVLESDVLVARYNADGSLDTTFGTDGIVTTDAGGRESVRSVVAQADGKIVVAGSTFVGTSLDVFVVRYDGDGSLDTTFGTDGIVTTDIGGDTDDWGRSLGVQSDGRIVVGGGIQVAGAAADVLVVRYDRDGSLDTTFGVDGIVTTDFGDKNASSDSLVLQSDGRIVVAGSVLDYDDEEADVLVARYTRDGSLDSTFGDDGIVTTDLSSSDLASSLVLQSDGKIVVVGRTWFGDGSNRSLLVRYDADGSLDATFGGDGVVTTERASIARAVAVQSDGKLVVAGDPAVDPSSPGDEIPAYPDPVSVARFDSDGSLDSTFGDDGILTTLFGVDVTATAHSVVVQSDGKIIVAGKSHSSSSEPANLLVAVRFGREVTP